MLASQVDVLFAVSRHVRDGLIDLGVPESKVQVNLIGIDFQRYRRDDAQRAMIRSQLGLGAEDTLILVTSHFRPGKGVELMPEVAAALRPRKGRCFVAVAAEGPKRAEIEALAAGHALGPDRFRLLGRRDGIPSLLSAADMFMLPTDGRFEGLPVGALEALACGVPGIVTDVSGLRSELGAIAMVVAPGSVSALPEAAQLLLDDPDEAARMATAAQEMIRANYSVEKGASDLVAAYFGSGLR
ncbi:MAG: hypothetical protein C0524_17620 [Rhodobacter sp.]|nr:hypothetical protein [Rhodobacter sp.]